LDVILKKFIRDRYPGEAKKNETKVAEQVETHENNPKIIKSFCRDADKVITALRETASSGDTKQLASNAHAIKSALASIGEPEISGLAYALEKAGHESDGDYIDANRDDFIDILEKLVSKLRSETAADADDSNISEDTAYLAEQLEIAKSSCDDYDDTSVYATLDRIKEKPWKNKTIDKLEQIHDTLYFESDFEGAGEKIRSLLEALK